MWNKFILFFIIFPSLCRLSRVEIIPYKAEIDYYDTRFFKHFNITVKKTSRRSPYTACFSFETLTELGDNLTDHFIILEKLSGRYHPTMMELTIPLCKILDKGARFHEFIEAVFPRNLTCPVPAGKYEYKLETKTVNLPFNLPFTWDPLTVNCRSDVEFFGYPYGKKLVLLKYKLYATVKQKPMQF